MQSCGIVEGSARVSQSSIASVASTSSARCILYNSRLHGPGPAPLRAARSCRQVRRKARQLALATVNALAYKQTWEELEEQQNILVRQMDLSQLAQDMPTLLVEMGLRYDPDRLAAALSQRSLEINARAVKVATLLLGFAARVAADYAAGNIEANMRIRATELRQILSSLGPAFVKVGQALSARPDLLPGPYLEVLSDLQDKLPPFPNDIAYALIEQELGRPISQLFSELSVDPVAAASLGQVYRGRVRGSGEEVAVKVQRPGIGDGIAIDMILLRRLMRVVDTSVTPRLNISQPLVPLVDEFARRLFGELDYEQEGHNCEHFQELYGNMPRIRTPAIFWGLTSRRVLTMEWIDGIKLTDRAAMDAAGLDIIDFVDVGIECTLRQLLEHGYFHADPHPGNLLAARDGCLVYLDFGMMSSAPQYARYAIIAHVVHLVNRDYQAMCRDYYTLEFMDPSVDTSPIAPQLAAFFDNVLDRSVAELNFKAIVDGLGEVLFQFPFRVPAYYALILRSLTVLEGLALQADSNYKLLGRAYPYMAKRLLTDGAPELRASFEDLVLEGGRIRWARLENLVEEGSKSSDFDPAQLWLLAEWVLSDAGSGVRQPFTQELIRVLDTMLADDVRRNIQRSFRSPELAERLVPRAPYELEAAARAALVQTALQMQVGPMLPAPGGGYGTGVAGGEVAGLQRLLNPLELRGWLDSLQDHALHTWPRLQRLLELPGAGEVRAALQAGLSQRLLARMVKAVLGPQPAPAPPPRYTQS